VKLSSDNLYLFFRQLGEMMHCGIGMVPSLDVLARDEDGELTPLAKALVEHLEHGKSLSQGLRLVREGGFPSTLVVLVEIGETTGNLPESILQAAEWIKEDRELVRQAKSSLTYPLFVFGVACALALLLFTTVVPKLLEVVVGLGADLPWPTRVVMAICWVITEPFFWLAGGSALCFAAWILSAPGPKRRAKRAITKLALELPLIGPTLSTYYFVRFCSGLAVLVNNGASILEAVSLAQRLSGHPDLLEDQFHFRERVELGKSLGQSMQEREDIYPPMIVSFVLMGEESAQLAESLDKVASFLSYSLQEKLHTFRQAVEPLLTLMVGCLVALVLMATLLPLYSIVNNLGP
jgi:type IV pilus assembly protein PilC